MIKSLRFIKLRTDKGDEVLHSPPLAYSMIRYKVFSVSITSNKWTVTHSGREVNTKAM